MFMEKKVDLPPEWTCSRGWRKSWDFPSIFRSFRRVNTTKAIYRLRNVLWVVPVEKKKRNARDWSNVMRKWNIEIFVVMNSRVCAYVENGFLFGRASVACAFESRVLWEVRNSKRMVGSSWFLVLPSRRPLGLRRDWKSNRFPLKQSIKISFQLQKSASTHQHSVAMWWIRTEKKIGNDCFLYFASSGRWWINLAKN